jgi:pepsin A
MLIDTGSSDAILNPGVYKPSSSSQDTRRPFEISYATTNPDGSGRLTVGSVLLGMALAFACLPLSL